MSVLRACHQLPKASSPHQGEDGARRETRGSAGKQLTDPSIVDVESAISLTGFGKYQWSLLIVCGMTYMAFCYQGILSSYVGPAAQCDLQMTSKDQGLLNAIFILGGMSSAILWGILSDQYGRRNILVIALLADGLLTAVSSLAQTLYILLIFRFVSGFIMVAPGSVILTYLVETVGAKYRSKCMISMGAFCTLGFVFLPLLSIVILPIEWKYQTVNFTYNSWRMLLLVSSVPSLASAILLHAFFFESPKFLYSQGDISKSLYVIERIYYINYGNGRGTFPVKNIKRDAQIDARRSTLILDPDNLDEIIKSGKSWGVICKGIWGQAKGILKPPYLFYSILSNLLMFTCLFAYYGLALWFPKIFDLLEEHSKVSEEPMAVCELTYERLENSRNQSLLVMEHVLGDGGCENKSSDISVYINTFIIGLATVIGNVIFAFVESKAGNKLLTIITMLVSACCTLATYYVNTTLYNLLVACAFLTFTEAATMVIQAATSSLFPTKIRGLAMCVAWLSGRTGSCASNLIIGYYIDTWCELPILLMAALLFFGTALGLFLPGKSTAKREAAI